LTGKHHYDINRITVISDPDENFYCLNNRRLYVFKEVGKLGLLEGRTPRNTISVRLKPAVPREQKKYSAATCSLKCALIREKGHSYLDNANETNEADLSDHDNDVVWFCEFEGQSIFDGEEWVLDGFILGRNWQWCQLKVFPQGNVDFPVDSRRVVLSFLRGKCCWSSLRLVEDYGSNWWYKA
jgi:hypothetical protein